MIHGSNLEDILSLEEKLSKNIDKPKVPYSLNDMAEDCINILNELSIKKHIFLVLQWEE